MFLAKPTREIRSYGARPLTSRHRQGRGSGSSVSPAAPGRDAEANRLFRFVKGGGWGPAQVYFHLSPADRTALMAGKELRYTYDHFGVVVQDLNAAIEELRSKGVKILQEPSTVRPGTHIAFVEGPDHTRIEVLQRDVPVG